MKLAEIRRIALSLADTHEEPHHAANSFRVNGKIFATLPPDDLYLHIFADDILCEEVIARQPDTYARLYWGQKAVGVRVTISRTEPDTVTRLLRTAWSRKAPRKKREQHTDP